MTLEFASYIAGIVAAVAGIGSLYYAREQHKKHKQNADNKLASAIPTAVGYSTPETTPRQIPAEFVAGGIPNELLIAFETTKGMFNKQARDSALQALIQKALAAKQAEFASAITSEMWNKSAKDEVLTHIVQHALREGEFQLAHQASELFFNMHKKDHAKRLIIDCIGNGKV